jgi:hypothetical protein
VLLISLDSTRRDMLGVYGRRLPGAPELSPTPEIDALAAAGVVFEDAYATRSYRAREPQERAARKEDTGQQGHGELFRAEGRQDASRC